jgi:hypothetical protein
MQRGGAVGPEQALHRAGQGDPGARRAYQQRCAGLYLSILHAGSRLGPLAGGKAGPAMTGCVAAAAVAPPPPHTGPPPAAPVRPLQCPGDRSRPAGVGAGSAGGPAQHLAAGRRRRRRAPAHCRSGGLTPALPPQWPAAAAAAAYGSGRRGRRRPALRAGAEGRGIRGRGAGRRSVREWRWLRRAGKRSAR